MNFLFNALMEQAYRRRMQELFSERNRVARCNMGVCSPSVEFITCKLQFPTDEGATHKVVAKELSAHMRSTFTTTVFVGNERSCESVCNALNEALTCWGH